MELPRTLVLQLFDLYRNMGANRLGLILASQSHPESLCLLDARDPEAWTVLLKRATQQNLSAFACFSLGPLPQAGSTLPSALAYLPLIEVNEETKGVYVLRLMAGTNRAEQAEGLLCEE